jgi:hypothetical protein
LPRTFEADVGTDLKRVLRLLEPIIIFGMVCPGGLRRRRDDACESSRINEIPL